VGDGGRWSYSHPSCNSHVGCIELLLNGERFVACAQLGATLPSPLD